MDYEELAKKLAELPDNEETRRRALLLKEFLVTDEHSKTQIADINNGLFRDSLKPEEAAVAERLFENIKTEFEIETQKDLMDLWLMVSHFMRTRRYMRAKVQDTDQTRKLASIIKQFNDSYLSIGRELGLSRQQRLVRKVTTVDEMGSITELFAGLSQHEVDTPKKRRAKKKRGISTDDEEQVESTA
jgi:hypothetical protein